MKKISIIFVNFLIIFPPLYSQNDLSFKFGLPISSAQVLHPEKTIAGFTFTPTVSCGYFSLSALNKETRDGKTNEESMGAHIFIPRVGLRTPLKISNIESSLRRYIFTDIFTVIPLFTGDQADELKKDWDKQINLYGLIAGTGVEYFFGKDFSIGGEISMNVLVNSMIDERDEWYGDYYGGSEVSVKDEMSLRAGAIFTQFTLNYYFN